MSRLFKCLAALLLAGLSISIAYAKPDQAKLQEHRVPPQHWGQHWGFQGLFGNYNKATLQKGFVVYQTDCASCHGMSLVHFRDLRHLGLTAPEAAAIASATKIQHGINAKGKPNMVPATVDDVFQPPFPTEQAAAARFHGAVPQDLSLITKARPNGVRGLYAMLTGYRPAPSSMVLLPHHHYNVAVPGMQIAMAPPLKPGSVTLANGKKPGMREMAHDVTEFLAWSADPNLDNRKATGFGALFFLAVLGALVFAARFTTRQRS
jgi:ubiquinol-cytochrome c reductase cytochrome c1 subunit